MSQGVFDRFPSEVVRMVEDDSYLATCDWGYCNGETRAFAQSDSDASEEWMAVCAACAKGQFPDENDEPYPVDRVVWIAHVEAAMREEA